MPSRKKLPTIARKLVTWLKEEKRTFVPVDDEKTIINLLLDVSDFKVNVGIRLDHPDSVLVGATIGLTADYKKAFHYLKVEKKIEFQQNCELTILQVGVDYAFLPNQVNPTSVRIGVVIYSDGLTKHSFFDGIRKVTHALDVIDLQYARLKASVLNP